MPENAGEMVAAITNDAKLYMPLAELLDVAKEIERINKELKKAQTDYDRINGKLSNEGFLAKAPEQVVAAEREKAAKLSALIENLTASIKNLESMG